MDCPYCGEMRVTMAADGSTEENTTTALRSHILASSDDDHGPRNGYPPEFDAMTLSDHVVRVDGR